MRKFRTSKKFWLTPTPKFWLWGLIILALILIGLFIYFVILKVPGKIPELELPEKIKKDKIPPSTAVVSPEDKSWWKENFAATIYDSDLGSGLVDFVPGEKGCRYLIEDLGTDQVTGGFRKCDPVKIIIPVGEEKICSSSFKKENLSFGKCKVSTLAIDKAGNQSGWRSRVFNIDLIPPKVGAIFMPESLELNENYFFETTISDNAKITGCWFYVDSELINTPTKISPIPCENENQCNVSTNYRFEKESDFSVGFGCSDIAGNLGFGKPAEIKTITNHSPQIASCRVNPTQGTTGAEFQFEVSASDSDGDEIFYFWDFGDGSNSNEKTPVHRYEKTGTFEPRVVVSDEKGLSSECQTAWLVVGGD